MIKSFINRPVLSTVISIILLILGFLGLSSLPIEQYPDIAPPTVKVQANYVGANAETVLKSVVIPIEEAINGVEGMSYITSTSSNDGSATINIFFNIGTNPDIAAVNVQNRVATAMNVLPAAVIQTGVTTLKAQNSALMFMSFFSENKDHDEVFIQNYIRINILPRLQRINGVGDANIFGDKDYSMRIWLDPAKMASYKLVPADIQNALKEQNLEVSAGKFGENSVKSSYEYMIKYKGRLSEVKEFENIIIRSDGQGHYLRLKEVARVELDAFKYTTKNQVNGHAGAVIGLYQTPGSNAREIIAEAEKILAKTQKDFPSGLKYYPTFNSKDFLDASISKVQKTIIEAFILVFLVVFLFLQDFRSTLIPIIAVPVAVIGTFFFMNILGYSINMLTLFALVLSIGIVVDDAIVVVEAVHTNIMLGMTPKQATIKAMEQITVAVISITLIMVAVFVPVMFITGSSGVFYKQFAVTMCTAILISAVNALTLSPVLCTLFLKKPNDKKKKKRILTGFFNGFNKSMNITTISYSKVLQYFFKRKIFPIIIIIASIVISTILFNTTPKGFIPNEDRGNIFTDISLIEGFSLEETQEVVDEYSKILDAMPTVTSYMNILGFSIFDRVNGPSYALSVLKLIDWDERLNDSLQLGALMKKLKQKTAHIKKAKFTFFAPAIIRGFGQSNGFQVQLLNSSDDDWQNIDKVKKQFVKELNERPEIGRISAGFNPNFPQYLLDINLEKIKDANLSQNDLFNVLQGYYGGVYTTDFNKFGKQYKVMIQGDPKSRVSPESLEHVYIPNKNGESIAIAEFISLKRIKGPEAVFRYNLFKSVKITGKADEKYSSGDAINAIKEVAENLPRGYDIEFTGLSKAAISSEKQVLFVFLLSLLFVYFFLAAQYESYILPFAVLFCLPLGAMGALIFTNFSSLSNDIYFQVALIMLIGLLTKNAILIVEFALQRRKEGDSLMSAALSGATTRLRPILMTAFSCILGLLPLALATGIGAVGNRSIGISAVGGMLIGTVFGIFVIPFLFVIFQYLQEKYIRKIH